MDARILIITVTSFVLFLPAYLMAQHEPQDTGSLKVREKYGGVDNTPDHVVFAGLLRYLEKQNETKRDLAVEMVKSNMGLPSETLAEEFLDRLLTVATDLRTTSRTVATAVLCQDNTNRPKSEIYKAMDSLDDTRLVLARHAYDDFKDSLTENEQRLMQKWLEDEKEGYTYYALDHSAMYEGGGTDVKAHLQQTCLEYAQEALEGEPQ